MPVNEQDQSALVEAELDLCRALVAADHERTAAHLHPDLVYIHSNGVSEGRDVFLKALRDGRYVYGAIETRDVTPRFFGAAALLVGTTLMSVSTDGGPMLAIELRSALVWVKEDGKWLLLLRQTTRVK